MTIATHRMRCALQIDRVPQHDSRCYQVEATGPVALLLETAVPNFAQPVEEHSAGQRVPCFALVQPGMYAAAQLEALQLAQGHGQGVAILENSS